MVRKLIGKYKRGQKKAGGQYRKGKRLQALPGGWEKEKQKAKEGKGE